jgi:hypothetical protein
MRYSTGSAATRLAPFGATFLRVEPSARDGVEPVSNPDRASAFSDIVVLAIPWTSERRRLFDAKRLAKMKPGALPSSPSKATKCFDHTACSGSQREVYASCS